MGNVVKYPHLTDTAQPDGAQRCFIFALSTRTQQQGELLAPRGEIRGEQEEGK